MKQPLCKSSVIFYLLLLLFHLAPDISEDPGCMFLYQIWYLQETDFLCHVLVSLPGVTTAFSRTKDSTIKAFILGERWPNGQGAFLVALPESVVRVPYNCLVIFLSPTPIVLATVSHVLTYNTVLDHFRFSDKQSSAFPWS